jgi:hypothetical protein
LQPVFLFLSELSLGASWGSRVLIESLDLDILKEFVLTVKKILTFSKIASRQLRNLDVSQQSQQKSQRVKVSTEKFWFKKSWPRKKISGLDMIDNLETLKKLISTLRTILILISIGLDCWDPQAYILRTLNSLGSCLKLWEVLF